MMTNFLIYEKSYVAVISATKFPIKYAKLLARGIVWFPLFNVFDPFIWSVS